MVGAVNTGVFTAPAAGTHPPVHLLSDEKFANLAGKQIYLFLVAQSELIWYGEWMNATDEATFQATINRFLTGMDTAAQTSGHLQPDDLYAPTSVTTDGWKAAQNAWESEVSGLDLMECKLHGKKRIRATLDDLAKAHPDKSLDQLHLIRDDLNAVLDAPSRAAYAQRVRRNRERYVDEPLVLKRLDILKEKQVLFTNHLKYDQAPAYSAPLDRSMRFLDEKLQVSGQYRAADAINPMLNAWAIVNNLRPFLPDAIKAGQSLAQHFGAKLNGLPWMEALNLCTVGNLDAMILSTS